VSRYSLEGQRNETYWKEMGRNPKLVGVQGGETSNYARFEGFGIDLAIDFWQGLDFKLRYDFKE
jgi:hypothetical protein